MVVPVPGKVVGASNPRRLAGRGPSTSRSTEDGRSREADVYDANGRFIAIAEWPRILDLLSGYPAIRGRVVHAVVTDASDLERIVRLQFR